MGKPLLSLGNELTYYGPKQSMTARTTFFIQLNNFLHL